MLPAGTGHIPIATAKACSGCTSSKLAAISAVGDLTAQMAAVQALSKLKQHWTNIAHHLYLKADCPVPLPAVGPLAELLHVRCMLIICCCCLHTICQHH